MATTLKRIEAREFEKLAEMTGLGAAAREMARLVLVDGKTLTEAADMCDSYKQRVSLAVNSIRRVHQGAPTRSGWVKMEVEVPERLAKHLAELLEALRGPASRDARALALAQIERAMTKARSTLESDQSTPN